MNILIYCVYVIKDFNTYDTLTRQNQMFYVEPKGNHDTNIIYYGMGKLLYKEHEKNIY
jgi:hypothetical protein